MGGKGSGEKMMIRGSAMVAACLALTGCVTVQNVQSSQNAQAAVSVPRPAPPPSIRPNLAAIPNLTVNKTAASGHRMVLSMFSSLNPDCTPIGPVEGHVETRPSHGSVTVEAGSGFTNYRPNDPPFACNHQRTPGTVATYESAPGYTGPDTTSIFINYPSGRSQTVNYFILVK